MERGEESPVFRVPPVDCVSARVRGSRPVGPPPSSNTFDVPQPPPPDGGGAGTHYTTLGVIFSQVARNTRRLSLPTGRRDSWLGAEQRGLRAGLHTAAGTDAGAAAAVAEQLARNARPLTRLAARNAAGTSTLPATVAGSEGDGLLTGDVPPEGRRSVPPRE